MAEGEVTTRGNTSSRRDAAVRPSLQGRRFRESAYTKEAEVVRREISPQGDLVRTQALVVLPEKALPGGSGCRIP